MVHHEWGDPDVDWKGISDAAAFIADHCVKWARMGGDYKEKYGTCRNYVQFGLTLHSLIFPRWIYRYHDKWPKWAIDFDYKVFQPICRKLGLVDLWHRWQVFIYSRAYHLAINKWPHLRAEILCGTDHPELIDGVTRQVYNEEKKDYTLEILGWNNEKIGGWICDKPWFDEKGKLIK